MSGQLVAIRTFDRKTLGASAPPFPKTGSGGTSLQQLGYFLLEHALRTGADLLIDHLTALDKKNRRDVATALLSSTSHLPIATRPSYSAASSSIIGAIVRQGPHHSAQKSTTSGLPESIRVFRFSEVIASAISVNFK